MKRFNETYGKRKFLSRNEWADTYKAIHSKTEEKVIVKVLVNKSHDEVYINNLSKDIEILKNINSPNLIHVHDMFQYSACGKNYYYIESEYFKGITLKEKLESEKFSQKEAVKIVEQIAEVLKEFHNSNLSFDTLDLESILINSKNLVKIDILSYLENKKFIVNMEENTEIVAFNPENDIYSIGVILYNLLSGKTVFEKEKYKKDINDANLARVIEKSTNNEIENKYKNIDRLIIDLKSYLLCGEIKDDSYDDEIKVNVKSKNKKDKKVKKEKKKKEKVDKKKNKNKKEKIIKEEVVKEDIEKKEEKTEKKGKVGKTLGICAAVAIVAGAGVYAYDSIQKNNNLEAEENKTQIEENIKVQEEESEKVDTKVEDKTEDVVKEENTTKETSKEKQESSSSTKKNSTTKKKENSTSSSSNSNKNNESSSNSNSSTSNSNNNSSTNKPSNNTTNKPSNNTNNSGSSTSKPENNNNSSTTTKPDKEESTPEVPPTTDDSNSNSGNDSEASPETPEVELEN